MNANCTNVCYHEKYNQKTKREDVDGIYRYIDIYINVSLLHSECVLLIIPPNDN
jgi:hypothetical protein